MPSASTKTDKASIEASDPLKQALFVLDKKVRNLEKRKTKLDQIKQKAQAGQELEKDQQVAIEKYNEVVQNLEYSKELQKQFISISSEAEKLLKRRARRDRVERQAQELKRLREVLQLQNLLDNLGSDGVRSDFKTGKQGAVVLTEDNLNQLDELYQLISPTRDEGDYVKKLTMASEHIVSLLDGKDKSVVGTTYKELKELIDLINGCGYFDSVNRLEVKTEAAEEETHAEAEDNKAEENEADVADNSGSQVQDTPLNHPPSPSLENPLELVEEPPVNNIDESSYYANNDFQQRQRPIDEIVLSVQGNFNFLQESTIDVDSPHIDPAVVAAQPMVRQTSASGTETDGLSRTGFGTQAFGDRSNEQTVSTQPLGTDSTSFSEQQHILSQSVEQSLEYTSQSFGQNALSQTLPNDSLFQSAVEDSVPSHNMMGQTDNSVTPFDLPPSIPMPSLQEAQQSNISNQSEKKFTMNASAPVFQSMYSQAANQGQVAEGGPQQMPSQGSETNQTVYHGNNRYPNDGFQQRGGRGGGGGFRGRGGRGGGGNNNSIQNGFSRGGSGPGGRGGRGGSSYQGYPPRNDYRAEGYQGYNGGFGSAGFQKRGGSGGHMRGGSTRGSGGAMRGGAGGLPRGGTNRGGSRGGTGGFGRPASGQFQQ